MGRSGAGGAKAAGGNAGTARRKRQAAGGSGGGAGEALRASGTGVNRPAGIRDPRRAGASFIEIGIMIISYGHNPGQYGPEVSAVATSGRGGDETAEGMSALQATPVERASRHPGAWQ